LGNEQRTGRNLHRRDFLKASGALSGAVALGLTGCSSDSPEAAPGPTPRPTSGSGVIQLPDQTLPEGEATFRLIDSDDTKTPYWEALFAAYEEGYPNLAFEYDGLAWASIGEVLPLGISNGTAHDVFQLPGGMISRAVADGWVAPFDDVMPNFEEWKASYPEGVLAEGVQIFDGKTYALPLTSSQRTLVALHYNRELMEQAGYDPMAEPLTWDTYRDAARKITEQGDGETYGVVLEVAQPPRLVAYVSDMARMAGAVDIGGGWGFINTRTGEYNYTSGEYEEAINLILALQADGSIFPGSSSLIAPEAWPRVVTGAAGMVTGGPWVAKLWQTQNPEFDFGVGHHPIPGPDHLPMSYVPQSLSDALWLYADSPNKEIAGAVLAYVGSLEGQMAWGEIVGLGSPAIYPEAREAAAQGFTPQGQKAVELGTEMVSQPNPIVRNPDVQTVVQEMVPPAPGLGELVQAIFVGEVTDVAGALQDLKDRSERALDEAIEAAQAQGAEVSRDDWIFPDWDAATDFTEQDYADL
jgi:multiple sugar transport system substrate-binding protein